MPAIQLINMSSCVCLSPFIRWHIITEDIQNTREPLRTEQKGSSVVYTI